jgi:hypothetical protein
MSEHLPMSRATAKRITRRGNQQSRLTHCGRLRSGALIIPCQQDGLTNGDVALRTGSEACAHRWRTERSKRRWSPIAAERREIRGKGIGLAKSDGRQRKRDHECIKAASARSEAGSVQRDRVWDRGRLVLAQLFQGFTSPITGLPPLCAAGTIRVRLFPAIAITNHLINDFSRF